MSIRALHVSHLYGFQAINREPTIVSVAIHSVLVADLVDAYPRYSDVLCTHVRQASACVDDCYSYHDLINVVHGENLLTRESHAHT